MSSIFYTPSSKPWTPHDYQKKAEKFLVERDHAALFLDPGLGKTGTSLAAFKFLKDRGLANRALIIAPLRVCHSVWPKEILKWTDFKEFRVKVLHGKGKEVRIQEDADLYIINPEGLAWLMVQQPSKYENKNPHKWSQFGFDTLIIDELTRFKNTSTKMFKIMRPFLPTFTRRWGLTGSPAANGLIDLFGQCYMLDKGEALGKYITHYRRKYFDQSYNGFEWTLKEGGADRIYNRLAPLALRMGDDVIDMPELVENNIVVTLPSKVMVAYKELEKELIARLNEDLVTASTTASAIMKCRQIASGGLYQSPPTEALWELPPSSRGWSQVHTEKVKALMELIEELQGEPLLVAYEFLHDLKRIQKVLGDDVPYIGGGVSAKKGVLIEDKWNRGDIPVLLGHPQSIAHGLNLQGAGHHIAWFSPTWNYELYDQFNRRLRRQGNKSSRVFVHHIVADGTIDEIILDALSTKKKGQDSLFKALSALCIGRKL